MTKAIILREVKKAMEATAAGFSGYSILSNLSEALTADIRTEVNKTAGAGKIEKILKSILDLSKKEFKGLETNYPAKFAHVEGGAMYATDTFRLLKLYNPISAPLLEDVDPAAAWFNVYKIINEKPALTPVLGPDPAALKAFLKCTETKERPAVVLESEDGKKIMINARWYDNAISNLSEAKIYAAQYRPERTPVYITGLEGEIAILPIHADLEKLAPGFYYQSRNKFTGFWEYSPAA